ncbi:MAG: glycine cleavage system transcriptional repressor [Candidatus Xenobia bacterium]
MKEHLLLSLVGADRTGLVDHVSRVILQHRGNLEDSRMAVLGGEFAMLMLVTIGTDGRAALEAAIHKIAADLELTATIKPTSGRGANPKVTVGVQVEGMDHEGIVHDVVHYLAEKGVSVQALESQIKHAPHTGTPLFSMRLTLAVPPAIPLSLLQEGLAAVADRLNVTIEVAQPGNVTVPSR